MRLFLTNSAFALLAICHSSNRVLGFIISSQKVSTTQSIISIQSPIFPSSTVLFRGSDGKNPDSFEGTDMTITEYPHQVLRRLGDEIVDFDDELQQICDSMITIMYAASGVGLAAPQVNLSRKLFVYNPTGDPKRPQLERIVVNPKIVEYSKAVAVEEEACLSSRSGKCAGLVSRSKEIMVEYQTEKGGKVRKKLKDFEARVFQHEYDHVMGILHFDRLCPEDRTKIQPTLDLLIQTHNVDQNGDAVLKPDETRYKALQPAPLPRRGWMPPLADAVAVGMKAASAKQRKKNAKKKSAKGGGGGFGGGGFGKK